jgi:hypothetical protein
MLNTTAPFLAEEVRYRQLRAIEQYNQKPSRALRRHRRHLWVPRRPVLHLPRRPGRTTAVA